MHTNLTMNRTMRKFVTFMTSVACLALFLSCDTNQGEAVTSSKKPAQTSVSKKKAKTPADTLANDTLSDLDISLAGDNTFADTTAFIDSALNSLPLPESEIEIDWESAELVDTLQTGTDEEISEEWTYDLVHEEDVEYLDYSIGEGTLNKERILKTEIVIVKMPDFQDERDSVLAVVEERMSLNPEKVSRQIVVEKWFSPVNYRGYKFNRKKLMLYGVERETLISIYFYLDEYYFAFNQNVYNLDESARNLSFVMVQDTVLTNYLLKYGN